MMIEEIKRIQEKSQDEFASAVGHKELEQLRTKYLGKRGILASFLKRIGTLDSELRPAAGKAVNDAKRAVVSFFEEAKSRIESSAGGDTGHIYGNGVRG